MNTSVNAASMQPFQIISFLPNPSGSKDASFRPHSIMRASDEEVFTLDDVVTNGSDMVGRILKFELLNEQVFVTTTWSGVGMNLDSLEKLDKLPSKFQLGDNVLIDQVGIQVPLAWVIKVHFMRSGVQYDLQLYAGPKKSARMYNVDEGILTGKE